MSSFINCLRIPVFFYLFKGSGIQKSFILDATLKVNFGHSPCFFMLRENFRLIHLNIVQFPMLRLLSLDMCDAKEGGFDVPEVSNNIEHL